MMILENEHLKIEFEPATGGKIVSFIHKAKDFQLAAQKNTAFAERPGQMESFAPYAFGLDDAFPNINAEEVDWYGRKFTYPDHGEIWSAGFNAHDSSDGNFRLEWVSAKFGYRYQKHLYLNGNTLHIRYHIMNESKTEIPGLWTWHGLMRYEENMRVFWPLGTRSFLNVQANHKLGQVGARYDIENSAYNFWGVPQAKTMSTAKYYVEHPVHEGRCGLYYPTEDVTFIMEYDCTVLPYLGFWVTAGGFQGDYNCALEPTNGFYDSVSTAQKNGKLPVLQPGESLAFELRLTLK